MNRTVLPFSVLLAAIAATAIAGVPAPSKVPAVPLRTESFYDTWLKDRLSVGLGLSYATLTDAKRPKDVENGRTFVGYVWKLEDTDRIGVVPELRYWASDYVRLVLSTDRVSGRTRNYNLEKHSDGDVDLWGPQLLVEGLYPLCDETVFLHAGAGIVYDFAEAEGLDTGDAYECWDCTVNERDGKTLDGEPVADWKAYVRAWCSTRKGNRGKKNGIQG